MPETPAPGSSEREVASWGRRILALLIDWVACLLVVRALTGGSGNTSGADFYPLLAFWIESALGTMTVGGSFGQLLTRIRVLRLDGGRLNPVAALLRSALICLVIPPLVFRPDGRGLHDLATDAAAYELPR